MGFLHKPLFKKLAVAGENRLVGCQIFALNMRKTFFKKAISCAGSPTYCFTGKRCISRGEQQLSTEEIIGLIGCIIGLAILILLVFKRVHLIYAGILATVAVGIFNMIEPWAALTLFAEGVGANITRFMYIFFFATTYGLLMGSTGCAEAIAQYLVKLIGTKRSILVIILATGLLVYGGVSALVVSFTMFPIAIMLIRDANISKALLPGMLAFGQGTFALTALPGTPQLNNLIPGEYLGTKSTAAPVLGLIAAVIMFVLGLLYFQWQVKKNAKCNIGFFDGNEGETMQAEIPDTTQKDTYRHKAVPAFMAVFILMGCFLLFDNVGFGGYEFTAFQAINTAMFVAIIYLCILGFARDQKSVVKETLVQSAQSFITPLVNFTIVVGFGYVIQNTAGFNALINSMLELGGSTYVTATITVCILAGVTGSASGGLQITMSNSVLVETWLADKTINTGTLHRILSVSSCTLDSLPHCGGIMTALNVCRETHASSYKHIFIASVVIPLITTIIIIALALMGLTL